jgi:hypothetical protein
VALEQRVVADRLDLEGLERAARADELVDVRLRVAERAVAEAVAAFGVQGVGEGGGAVLG